MTSRTVTWHCPPKTVLGGVDFGDASARAVAISSVLGACDRPVLFIPPLGDAQ